MFYRYLSRKKKKLPYQGFSNLSCSGGKITKKPHNANLTIPSLSRKLVKVPDDTEERSLIPSSNKSKSITGKQGRAGGMKNCKTSSAC